MNPYEPPKTVDPVDTPSWQELRRLMLDPFAIIGFVCLSPLIAIGLVVSIPIFIAEWYLDTTL